MSFKSHITIRDRKVGPGEPVLIIAEAGVNHFGDLDKALKLVDLAFESGADVFKTQAFNTDRLISSQIPEWKDRLRPKEVDFEFLDQVKQHCDKRNITFLCTPHDESVLDWLDKWDMPAYKIGSGERGNIPFIRKIAERNKPIILSTGMYSDKHIDEVLEALNTVGQKELALLHCVTCYPSSPEQINLNVIKGLREKFEGPVGYSDHTQGFHIPFAAVAMGADIIEKHITLDFNVPNAQDWKVSAGPDDFADFVKQIREIESCFGDKEKGIQACEEPALSWALKSLVLARHVEAGTPLTEKDLISKRPGTGISPSCLEEVIGKTLNRRMSIDEIIKWDDLS